MQTIAADADSDQFGRAALAMLVLLVAAGNLGSRDRLLDRDAQASAGQRMALSHYA